MLKKHYSTMVQVQIGLLKNSIPKLHHHFVSTTN